MLLALGCRFGQGYLFGRPGPLREVADASLAVRRVPGAAGDPWATTGRYICPSVPPGHGRADGA